MTNAEALFNNSLRPRKSEGSLGRTAQDVHLDSHTAPELWVSKGTLFYWYSQVYVDYGSRSQFRVLFRRKKHLKSILIAQYVLAES